MGVVDGNDDLDDKNNGSVDDNDQAFLDHTDHYHDQDPDLVTLAGESQRCY